MRFDGSQRLDKSAKKQHKTDLNCLKTTKGRNNRPFVVRVCGIYSEIAGQ